MKLFALVLATALPFSCAHAPVSGDPCKEGAAVCSSSSVALTCRDGHYVPAGCAGPLGCRANNDSDILCDQSRGAIPGALCFPSYEGQRQCSTDGNSLFQCLKGAWVQTACPQGLGCHAEAGGVLCL